MRNAGKLVLLLGGLLASATGGAAVTKTYSWGALETSDRYSHQVAKAAFSDLIRFELASGATYDVVFDIDAAEGESEKFARNPAFGFELLAGEIVRNAEVQQATRVAGSTIGSFSDDLVARGLSAGWYTLHVFGKGTANSSKYFVDSIGVASHPDSPPDSPPVANVPEPGTYAMLLAGLGLVGVFARRRGRS